MTTEWFQHLTYDGLALSVMFDEQGPCEIMAASTGDCWTECFVPHINGLIFAAAKEADRIAKAAEVAERNLDRGEQQAWDRKQEHTS